MSSVLHRYSQNLLFPISQRKRSCLAIIDWDSGWSRVEQKNKRSKEGATRHTWVVGKLRDFPVHRRLCVRGLDRGRWPAPVDDRGLRIWRQTESKRTDRENLLKSHFWTPVTINRLNQAANSIIFRYKGIYSKQRAEQTIKWGKKNVGEPSATLSSDFLDAAAAESVRGHELNTCL